MVTVMRLRHFSRKQAGCGDCTSIDHWIYGCTVLGIEADRIERIAARLYPHLAGHEFQTTVRQGGTVAKWFGNRLDSEELLGIPRGIGHAIHGDETDAKPPWVGLGGLWNITC